VPIWLWFADSDECNERRELVEAECESDRTRGKAMMDQFRGLCRIIRARCALMAASCVASRYVS
jgi:hypothetical protein